MNTLELTPQRIFARIVKHSAGMAATAAMAIVLALALAPADSVAQVTLRLTDASPKTHPDYLASIDMAKRIEDRTKGQVKIALFPESTLGNSSQQLDQVRRGIIDLGIVAPTPVADFNPAIGMLNAPYVFDDYEHVWRFFDGPGKPWVTAQMAKAGLEYIDAFEWGFRAMTNNVRPINSPDDLKGLKMRVPPEVALKAIMGALGATPVTIAFQEVYMALASNMVDGQDNPLATIHAAKFYEVQKYMAITNHQYTAALLVASPKTWAKLSPDQQQIIREEAHVAALAARKAVFTQNDKYREDMQKAGVTVTFPNVAVFRAKMGPANDQIRNVVGADAFTEVQRLAEATRKK